MGDLYQNIKKLADNRKIQYKDIAETLGVSQNTVTNWFKGQNSMKAEFIPTIAKLLRVSIEELFREEKEQPPLKVLKTEEVINVVEEPPQGWICPVCATKDKLIASYEKQIALLEFNLGKMKDAR